MTRGAKGTTSGAKLLTSGRRSKYYKFNTSIFSYQIVNSIEMRVTTNIYKLSRHYSTAKLAAAPLPQYSSQIYSFFFKYTPHLFHLTLKKNMT